MTQRIILTHDLIDETCNLSDLFDLNEISSLELLLTAEGHLASHSSGVSRAALAITLYFDSYSALAEALNSMIKRRPGRMSSSYPLPRDVEKVLVSFTEDLWQSGLLKNVLCKFVFLLIVISFMDLILDTFAFNGITFPFLSFPFSLPGKI